eukprot:RCo004789
MANLTHLTLSNGVRMPSLGFGCAFGSWNPEDKSTFFGFEPEQAWAAVPAALRAGYRHLDCALIYGTHRIVGISLGQEFAAGRLKRNEVFVTTKVFHPPVPVGLNHIGKTLDMLNPEIQKDLKGRVLHDFERCLDELNLGYVDLLLMHWPGVFHTKDGALNRALRRQCWAAFEEIYNSGRARAIGVSNFLVRHLEELLEDATVAPMVNQIEISPYYSQPSVVELCQRKGIAVVSWGPFGSGSTGVLKDPVVQEIARQHGKDAGQVILRWVLQQGFGALPKSSNEARIKGNLDVFDFQLTPEEMARLTGLHCGKSSVATSSDSVA